MSTKLFVVFAALCAVLLSTQTASCEDADVQLPDKLYILNPESVFPVIVTDPNSPLLDNTDPRITIVCNVQRCQDTCELWGYKYGRCNPQAICVCSNRL